MWAVFKLSNRFHIKSKRNDGHNLGNVKSTSKAVSLFKKEEFVLASIFQTAFFKNQALKKVSQIESYFRKLHVGENRVKRGASKQFPLHQIFNSEAFLPLL